MLVDLLQSVFDCVYCDDSTKFYFNSCMIPPTHTGSSFITNISGTVPLRLAQSSNIVSDVTLMFVTLELLFLSPRG
jgi:hypothetical protein